MTTTTRIPAITDSRLTPKYRIAADTAQRWLALLGVVLCALQIGFAAFGFWDAQAHGNGQSATRAAFEPHALVGDILQYLAVALLILGLVARSGWKAWVIPLVVGILLFVVQGLLVHLGFGVSAWFGFTHAVDGTVLTAGLVWLMLDRWRHPLH